MDQVLRDKICLHEDVNEYEGKNGEKSESESEIELKETTVDYW